MVAKRRESLRTCVRPTDTHSCLHTCWRFGGPFGRVSAELNDYHAAQMMQLQMLHMRLMCSS